MKAAVVVELGVPPRFGDFAEPEPGAGQVVVEVTAAGVHHWDVAKASGSYTPSPAVPFVAGSDGVGRTAGERRGSGSITLVARMWPGSAGGERHIRTTAPST
ncbi:alcohol dehydrogenase catalytic domain-containing protein [Nonomuraea sp. NPDC049400]|uniref:alcohol dehydrogenase catalytic domain-containing protein n=1 Tax=Nonomuraea sp. NPDC049400 TaxID=3364352 RepID=UPI0037B4FBE5